MMSKVLRFFILFAATIFITSTVLMQATNIKSSFAKGGDKMELKKLIPNLMVEDVNKTVKFYSENLSFELTMSVPDSGTLDWACMKQGDVEIMFQSSKSLSEEYPLLKNQKISCTSTFYIKMKGIETLYSKLPENSDIIIKKIHTTPYGIKEFAIQDCNGYILVFGETS